MGFNQRSTIANLTATVLVFGWYFYSAFEALAAGQTSVAEFGPRMWWSIGAYIVLVIAAMVTSAILSRHDGGEMGEFDERDQLIDRTAETVSRYVAGTGLLGVLYLVMQEAGTFMLAHGVLAVLVLQTATSFAVRLYLYNR